MSDSDSKPVGKPWPKGISGNPGGRTRGLEKQGQAFLKGKTYTDKHGVEHKGAAAMYAFLWEIAEDKQAKDRDRISAVKEFLDRSHGRAKQTVTITEDDGDADDLDLTPLTEEQLRVLAALDGGSSGSGDVH